MFTAMTVSEELRWFFYILDLLYYYHYYYYTSYPPHTLGFAPVMFFARKVYSSIRSSSTLLNLCLLTLHAFRAISFRGEPQSILTRVVSQEQQSRYRAIQT